MTWEFTVKRAVGDEINYAFTKGNTVKMSAGKIDHDCPGKGELAKAKGLIFGNRLYIGMVALQGHLHLLIFIRAEMNPALARAAGHEYAYNGVLFGTHWLLHKLGLTHDHDDEMESATHDGTVHGVGG